MNELNERERAKQEAANTRVGVIWATLVNQNRRKGAKPVTPEDLFRPPRREQTVEEIERALDAFAARQAQRLNRVEAN